MRAEPLLGGACAGGLGEARARGARWQAERGRGGVPGGEACSVGARSGEQGARGGRARARRARQRREEGERRGKERKERKKKKMGKRKEKRKRRGKRREKGERERGIRAGITALIAEPVGHAWRPGARERDARVEK